MDFILVLLIDDSLLMCIDTLTSWSKDIFKVNIENAAQTRLMKVADSQFIVHAMQFKLYDAQIKRVSVDGIMTTTFKLKILRELLAWDYASHVKCQLIKHNLKCTEMCQPTAGKDQGFDHLEILWKAREVRRVHHFCTGARVFAL